MTPTERRDSLATELPVTFTVTINGGVHPADPYVTIDRLMPKVEEWLAEAVHTGPFLHVRNVDGTLCGAPILGLEPEGLPFCPDCVERLIDMANDLDTRLREGPYRRSTP